ncbi:hypothetical protein AT5G44566 [Arabidopsis thaliana]|uniref:Uncharacterized protein n=1 Tax=Arabidopsis thaliana TaxID=3702 RepID=A0A1P8BDM7_ARATH|nr:uncharacterized protein AT5G44566 [Arabidopsis thaliana]ANM69661.1 hypothetical protein AT5G44566 [Arabidopsis thaliana]|eukprot:NP_001331323.1 hypothetical protein AT5G44566 [Arabidopsis thaliana]
MDLSHHPLDLPQFSIHRAGLNRRNSGFLATFGLEEKGYRPVDWVAFSGSDFVDVPSRSN